MYGLHILLSGLLLVHIVSSRECYEEKDVDKKANRKLRQYTEPGAVPASTPRVCPIHEFSHSPDISNRSISPWRYIENFDVMRVPRTIAVAECLCDGCIIMTEDGTGMVESNDYNSVPVKHTRLVVKTIPCDDKSNKYYLELTTEEVAVGCTCVKPKTHRENK